MRTLSLVFAAVSTGTLAPLLNPAPVEAQKRERDLITREELLEIAPKAPDLYQAVRKLRSHFLQPQRGPRSTGLSSGTGGDCPPGSPAGCTMRAGQVVAGSLPVLYVDDAKLGGDLEQLKNFLTSDIGEVRYLSANKAGMEFGLGHKGGAILVKLFKGVAKPPQP